jgi:hypothetical protein
MSSLPRQGLTRTLTAQPQLLQVPWSAAVAAGQQQRHEAVEAPQPVARRRLEAAEAPQPVARRRLEAAEAVEAPQPVARRRLEAAEAALRHQQTAR